ncbi:hypothetical protein R1sor_003020 [Riccia sorocarpa]|uniref:Cytochrome c oxidase subunit 5C n=1 Tax=Riccia sorocarpa TaxID=122646 RepID=A0ABD3H187_9MARC
MAHGQVAGRLAHHATKTATLGTSSSKPSLIREIGLGVGLGIFVGAFWKVYHVNYRRKVEDFYASYEKGEITVEAQG